MSVQSSYIRKQEITTGEIEEKIIYNYTDQDKWIQLIQQHRNRKNEKVKVFISRIVDNRIINDLRAIF